MFADLGRGYILDDGYYEDYGFAGKKRNRKIKKNILIGAGVAAVGAGTYYGGKKMGYWGQPAKPALAPGAYDVPRAPKAPGGAIRIPKTPGKVTGSSISAPVQTTNKLLPALKGGVSIIGDIFGTGQAQALPTSTGMEEEPSNLQKFLPWGLGVGVIAIGLVVFKKFKKGKA